MKTCNKYLPLKKYHIVELTSLKPEDIKISAKRVKRDREKIPYTTLLNAIVRSLGFRGGFAEYADNYNFNLKPFMEKHGLKYQADLFIPRKKIGCDLIPNIKPQALSERIFYSGLELPDEVFTGYNYNFSSISDGFYIIHNLIDSYGLMIGDSEDAIKNNIKLAQADPNKLIPIHDGTKRQLIDVVTGGFMLGYTSTCNLIGDSLCKPIRIEPEVELYGNSNYIQLTEEIKRHKLMFSFFRQRIVESDQGWIDVIPFNENLVFLRGMNGEYDYIFRNQRDFAFKHEAYGKALKIADIPSCFEEYHFSRWKYFEHNGWREKECHEAEILFYKRGGEVSNYPGQDILLKIYYEGNGSYKAKKIEKSNRFYDGFVPVLLNNKSLAISNLISIAEFEVFEKDRFDYMNYRVGENIQVSNSEDDKTLPATLTWYDALVYINWLQEKTRLPVRLMKYEEYACLREKFSDEININETLNKSDLVYFKGDGQPYESHPPLYVYP